MIKFKQLPGYVLVQVRDPSARDDYDDCGKCAFMCNDHDGQCPRRAKDYSILCWVDSRGDIRKGGWVFAREGSKSLKRFFRLKRLSRELKQVACETCFYEDDNA